ncbi:MAG: hypothetical protein IPP90_14930 [Gemmatimonadaceae bacterium]|nr:hypothetical protein [Gemmatimonadaceae bacterium]
MKDPDFLAVIDVSAGSPTYGQVLTTTPVGANGTMPHHLEYVLPDSTQLLFANGHMSEQIFLFNTADAERPRLVRTLPTVAPFRYPHDMVRLANGHVMVGFLRSEGASPVVGDTMRPAGHGGIAEVDSAGAVLRSASAADSSVHVPIRPYSFAFLPAIDRLLVTSAPMMEDTSADVIQMWRYSDFKLLGTTQVPPATLADGTPMPNGHHLPFEPRLMPDGSILFNAFGCGLYRVTSLELAHPVVSNVFTFAVPPEKVGSCGIPIVVGRYWLMAVGAIHAVVALDIRDPAHPVEVSRLTADTVFRPHWLAKDPRSDRFLVGAENGGENRMLIAHVDSVSGRLWWDETLKGTDGQRGITFNRPQWPHGATGAAFGHAALFRP